MTHDELQIAQPAQPAQPTASSSSSAVRCVGGRIVRPRRQEEESPSTQDVTLAGSRWIPQEEFNLVLLLTQAQHLVLDPIQEVHKCHLCHCPHCPHQHLRVRNPLQRPTQENPSGTSPPGYGQNGTGLGGDGTLNPGGGAPGGSGGEVQVPIQQEEESRQEEDP